MFELTYVFFALAMIFVSLYIGMGALTKSKRWFKKGKRLSEIEEEHERLRKQLRDLKSNGEKTKEKAMEKQIFEVEDKIEELAEDYRIYKAGGDVPLRGIPKKE